jgi:hypothetical protein
MSHILKKTSLIAEAIPTMNFGVASSIGNIKGRDKRSAKLRALDIAYASGFSGS